MMCKRSWKVRFCAFLLTIGLLGTGFTAVRAQSLKWTRATTFLANTVIFNPLSHGKVLYASSHDSEGIYKSYDGGYHWVHLFGGAHPLESGSSAIIGQLFIPPIDTSLLIVCSTSPRVGVYRSIDGGYNWTQPLTGVSTDGQTMFEYQDQSHQGHDTILFGESAIGHLYRSVDRGVSWDTLPTMVNHPSLCTLVPQPGSHSVLLAGSAAGAVSRSTDGGLNWVVTNPPDLIIGDADVPRIVFDPTNNSQVWATLYSYPGKSLIRSDDSGKTWSVMQSPLDEWAFEIDPENPSRIWMGRFSGLRPAGDHFSQTTDGGNTWIGEGLDSVVDIWQIRYDSSSGRLAVATSSGIYIAETRTGAVGRAVGFIRSIYPNPANRILNITQERNGGSVAIFDVTGRPIWRKESLPSGNNEIPVDRWPNGIYTLVRNTKGGVVAEKFVVGH